MINSILLLAVGAVIGGLAVIVYGFWMIPDDFDFEERKECSNRGRPKVRG